MKLLSLLILLASSVYVCCYETAGINDTNIIVTIASNGDVDDVKAINDPLGDNFYRDFWAAGIWNDTTSNFTATCNYVNAAVVSFTSNSTSVKSVVACTSSLVITYEFTQSKSTQMIKGTITLTNNGSSALPVVKYRRYTDYDVAFGFNNSLANYGIASAANLINSCFANFSTEINIRNIAYNFTADCALALAATAAFGDYSALYEYRFGPIAAEESTTFNVYYGASAGEASSFTELAKECVEVGSLFDGFSPKYLNYTYYVGYSGVGGNKSTFGKCASVPVPVPVPVPVRVPVPVAAPVPTRRGGCVSSLSTVEEKGQGIIPITELKIGDYVKTTTGIHTQVYGFGHFDHDREESFIQIHLEGVPAPFEISNTHIVFVGPNDRPYPVLAADIVVGDVLSGKKVMSLGHVVRRGVYAPLTMSGDIVVNGVTTSNYIDLLGYGGWYNRHNVAHAAFFPQRLFCRYFMEACRKETYTNGYGSYTRFILWCSAVLSSLVWMVSTSAAAMRFCLFTTMPLMAFFGMLLVVVVMKITKRDS